MIEIRKISEMREKINELKKTKKIGFVPTMGYLHKGHISLVEISKKNSDITIVSIYVNPKQFLPGEDFEKYPRDIERDKKILIDSGCDILFTPDDKEMYPENFLTYVSVDKLSKILCGASRPGHFDGVTTVVLKLFNIVKPDIAVFGEKDYQQLVIIKKMVEDLNLDVKIINGPIVREPDGLAMSSRNVYLNTEERKQALCLYKSLLIAQDMVKKGIVDTDRIISEIKNYINSFSLANIDYVKIVHSETLEEIKEIKDRARLLIAVKFGKTRLIDNCELILS